MKLLTSTTPLTRGDPLLLFLKEPMTDTGPKPASDMSDAVSDVATRPREQSDGIFSHPSPLMVQLVSPSQVPLSWYF